MSMIKLTLFCGILALSLLNAGLPEWQVCLIVPAVGVAGMVLGLAMERLGRRLFYGE